MAPVPGVPDSDLPYVVAAVEALGGDVWRVYVQCPDLTTVKMVIPGTSLTFTKLRLSATVVAQLWEIRRGATPVGQD